MFRQKELDMQSGGSDSTDDEEVEEQKRKKLEGMRGDMGAGDASNTRFISPIMLGWILSLVR